MSCAADSSPHHDDRIQIGTLDGNTTSGRRHALLAQIAALLDMPIEAFSEPPAGAPSVTAQASELLRVFVMITDPSARVRCLAFAQALAAEVDATRSVSEPTRFEPARSEQPSRSVLRLAPAGRLERQRRAIRSRRRKTILVSTFLWRRARYD